MVFTFIGCSFKSGGELGLDLLITALISGVAIFLLWFLIKAKSAENNLSKWVVAEAITLVVYAGFMVCTFLYGGFMHFFLVSENKEGVKEAARADIEKIDNMFTQYEEFERNAVATTRQGLINVTQRNQYKTDSLNMFLSSKQINATTVDAYTDNEMSLVLGSNYERLKEHYNNLKRTVETNVDSWSILIIPSYANKLEEFAKESQNRLTTLSAMTSLPIIELKPSIRRYAIVEANQHGEFKIEGDVESLRFRQSMTETTGFSVIAAIVALLIHSLVLFNYIMAYRTLTISVGKDAEEDGGRILY